MPAVLVLMAGTLACASAAAQKTDNSTQQLYDLSELTLDETLMIPEVPQKQKDYIKAYMKREAQALQKMGYKVETMRKRGGCHRLCACCRTFCPERYGSAAIGLR